MSYNWVATFCTCTSGHQEIGCNLLLPNLLRKSIELSCITLLLLLANSAKVAYQILVRNSFLT